MRLGVRDSLAEATATIAWNAETALAPTLGKLSGVMMTAQHAEAVLRQLIDGRVDVCVSNCGWDYGVGSFYVVNVRFGLKSVGYDRK